MYLINVNTSIGPAAYLSRSRSRSRNYSDGTTL